MDKWIKRRHGAVQNLIRRPFALYSRLVYGAHIRRVERGLDRQCLVLYNHQTPFDQFFVGIAFRKPVYYLATEDIFSLGVLSSLLRFLLAPIPIKKQTTDLKAVMNCIRVAREGGTIALAPEGNRTYSGTTEYINPAIASLAKKLGLPIAIFRIEGGYGVQPRWSDVIRRGRMDAYVSRIIEPEEYAALSADDLASLMEKELFVSDLSREGTYRHPRAAEYLERAIYICPRCGLSSFESRRDRLSCKGCGLSARYTPRLRLEGEGLDFATVKQWYDWQKQYVNALPLPPPSAQPLYTEQADVYSVIPYRKKLPVSKGAVLQLYGDRLCINAGRADALELTFEASRVFAVLGRNKLNVYHADGIYQFKGGKRFNALKYVHIFYHFKNLTQGDSDGKFLGL